MRTSRSIFLFSIINLIATIIFILYLPNYVIFGFLQNFYASELVNKWFNLIIPIIEVICALIIYLIDVFNKNGNHKYRYLMSWITIAFVTVFAWTLMFIQYKNVGLGTVEYWPWSILIMFPIGFFMLSEGYDTLTKDIKEPSIFGFKCIKNNNLYWEKVHNVAGFNAILVGISAFIIAVVNELVFNSLYAYVVIIGIWFVVYILITSIYAGSFKNK